MTRTSRVCVWTLTLALGSAALEPVWAWRAGSAQDQPPPLTPAQQQEFQRRLQEEDRRRIAEEERKNQERFRLTPLSVEIVVTRFQGDKKISSVPYTLAVNANESTGAAGGGVAQIRMGASVPVSSIAAPRGGPTGPVGPLTGPVNYRDIGTNIDCSAQRVADGSFQLRISVEDTSVYTNIQDKTTPTIGEMPVFRKFSSTNMLVMSDGQTREFTAATDRVSGEIVRVAVTLRVVK